jgi:hypothetical protein
VSGTSTNRISFLGAQLALRNYHSWSCNARPMTVHGVTQAWSAGTGHTFPGPAHSGALVGDSFAYGHIPSGQTTSPYPTTTRTIRLGNAGRDLVQRWVNLQQPNHGFTVRASTSDVFGWKRFVEAGAANPPRLSITHTPFNATYKFVNPVPNPPATRTQGGKVRLTVTNRGAGTWTKAGFRLIYRYFNSRGQYLGWAVAADLPHDVARNTSVTVDAFIKQTPPGSYRLEFSMTRDREPVFTDEQIPPAVLALRVLDVPPVVREQYPPNGYSTPSLTPTLWAKAVDVDSPPNASLRYRFEICEPGPVACFDSGRQPNPTWTVPAGRLQWSKTYQWRVFAFDGTTESPALPFSTMLTTVPQPEITAHLGAASHGGEFDPQVGNYTASAVDATVPTVGPRLSVVRTYNSLDPRRDGVFGAGWSSQYDMRITPDGDGSGNVVLTYPDGRQARFGANLNTSGQPTDGRLATVTNRASGRKLHVTWTGAHITTVSTDPVNGQPLTWAYTYDGDRLASAFDPNGG